MAKFPQLLARSLTVNRALLIEVLIQSLITWEFYLEKDLLCHHMPDDDQLIFLNVKIDLLICALVFSVINLFCLQTWFIFLQVFATMPSTSTASVDG